MKEHLDRQLRIEDIAAHVGLSSSRFWHLWRATTGSSPKQLLKQMRLERATELLRATDMALKEVAATVGMPNVSAFGRAFLSWHGLTPTLVRRHAEDSWPARITMHSREQQELYNKRQDLHIHST